MINTLDILKKAIENTKNNEVSASYYQSMMKQRLKNNEISAGSYYEDINTVEELESMFLNGEFEILSGSIEEGLIILKSNSFFGYEGIIPIENVNISNIVLLNPKNIPGREEQCIYVDSVDLFVKTNESHFIIGTKNQETEETGLEHAFFITNYPGKNIQADDTLAGGNFVKMIVKTK